jgi:hypothetical protein
MNPAFVFAGVCLCLMLSSLQAHDSYWRKMLAECTSTRAPAAELTGLWHNAAFCLLCLCYAGVLLIPLTIGGVFICILDAMYTRQPHFDHQHYD